jgi:hypothetical protein
VHTESEQYAVIVCEQSVELCSLVSFVVLFHWTANEVTIVASIWEMHSKGLSVLLTVSAMSCRGYCALRAASQALDLAVSFLIAWLTFS